MRQRFQGSVAVAGASNASPTPGRLNALNAPFLAQPALRPQFTSSCFALPYKTQIALSICHYDYFTEVLQLKFDHTPEHQECVYLLLYYTIVLLVFTGVPTNS